MDIFHSINWRVPILYLKGVRKEYNPVKPKILIVDDERILKQISWVLEPQYEVFTASNEAEALNLFEKEKPPVVTLDISLNPQDPSDLCGMRLLEGILSQEPLTRVIVVTGNNDENNVLRALRLGAFDYYSKPIGLEEIKVTALVVNGYL